jgi:hypothetical protein
MAARLRSKMMKSQLVYLVKCSATSLHRPGTCKAQTEIKESYIYLVTGRLKMHS